MAREQELAVRRAKAGDAGTITAFVNRALMGHGAVDERAVIERLGSVGFLLAEWDGHLVGMLGWQAENLVARVTDLLVGPAPERLAVGRALFSEMERVAAELQCEAALLFLPRSNPPQVVEFCKALGYEPRAVAGLPRVWQEAAREAGIGDDEAVLMKQLRARRVTRPL
jgi:dephospho-CoA kinase